MSLFSGIEKILSLRGSCHDFLSNFFCLTGPKNFVMEPFCVSENFWYRKSFMDRRRVGYHVFPSIVFASHTTKNFPRGTPVFQKCYGVEFFLDNRSITILSFFCLTLPKNSVEELFCVSECFGYRKTFCLRGEYHDFVSKNCCRTVLEKIVGTFWCIGKLRVSKKLLAKGVSRFSVENFCLTVPKKIRRRTFPCLTKFRYPKILMIKGGGVREYHNSLSKTFGLSAKKIVCEPFSVSLFSGIEKFYD